QPFLRRLNPSGCSGSGRAGNGDGRVTDQCRQCAACQPEFAAAGGAVPRIGGYTLVVCQPCRAGWLPLRGSYCGAPPLRPGCKGKIPLRTPWPAFQLFPCLSKPIEHTRPRGIHAPGHSFGVIQTMLLALANFGQERMGRNNQQRLCRKHLIGCATRTKAKKPKSQKAKKPKSQKNYPGRRPQKSVQVAAVFPAHSGQPAGEGIR